MPSASLRDIQYDLKKRLSEGGIESVLQEMEQRLNRHRTAMVNDLTLLISKYNDAKKQFTVHGTIEYKGEFETVSNKTRQGLLFLIDSLTEADLRPPDDSSPLMPALRALPIDRDKALMPVSLVNCDRTDAGKTYRGARREKINDPFHFFLVKACPLQMPHSFAERMIWEEVQKLDGDPDAHFYFKPNGPERILIQALPVEDGDAEATLDAIKSGFSNTHSDFFQKNFSHAAFGFALHEKNWDDDALPECLPALLDWLRELSGKSRRLFAFFFVVYIENFDRPDRLTPRQVLIRQKLAAFAQHAGKAVTSISLKQPDETPGESAEITGTSPALLQPVTADEVEKWLHRISQYGHAPNAPQILTLFDQFVAEKYPDRHQKGGPYDMRNVQELQKMICTIAQGQS